MKQLNPEDFDYYRIRYTIESSLEAMENGRFCQFIHGNITRNFDDDRPTEQIGIIEGYKILSNIAEDEGMPLLDVIDYEQVTFDVGMKLYDTVNYAWVKEVEEFYNYDLIDRNLLLLSRIEILPPYRGKDVGKKAIKDFYNNFIQGCGLYALKCFPIQCEGGVLEEMPERAISMQLDGLERDYATAFKKLHTYYKSLGFTSIKGLPKEIMVINPGKRNKKFEAIKLD